MPQIVRSEVVIPKDMSAADRRGLADALYEVHSEIFDGVDRDAFVAYVIESKAEDTKILLHKSDAGEIVGYFALHVFAKRLRGAPISVIRMEAGTRRAYRGQNSNLAWGIAQAMRLLARADKPTYTLSSLVHPSSYLQIARYLDRFWPRPDEAVPADILDLMLELAEEFHLDPVDPRQPLVRKVGWKTRDTEVERNYWRHCDKPPARFFVGTNPGYGEGHGLLTLAAVSRGDLVRMAGRVVRGKAQTAVDGALVRIQHLPFASRLIGSKEARKRLSAAPIFAGLDAAQRDELVRGAETLLLPGSKDLFREGEAGEDLFLIARGAVYVLVDEGGQEIVIDELDTGAIFGEIAMLSGGARTASIRTAIPTTLVRLRRAALMSLMARDATLRDAVWHAFAARVFDDNLRASGLYPELGRTARQAWIRRGVHEDLRPGQVVSAENEAFLFVLSGAAFVEQDGSWMSVQAPTVVAVKGPVRLEAKRPVRLVRVPPLAQAAAS